MNSAQSGRVQSLADFRLPPGFRGRSAFLVQLWWLIQMSLFAWSPQFMYGWRRYLLRCFGAQIGDGVKIRPSATVTYPWRLRIGEHSWVGDDAVLYTLDEIAIGDNVCISQKAYLCAGTHDYRQREFPMVTAPITIESEAWIATDVFVAPGVRVGYGAVVGARSSVFCDIAPMTISVGSPAKCVRDRLSPHESALTTCEGGQQLRSDS